YRGGAAALDCAAGALSAELYSGVCFAADCVASADDSFAAGGGAGGGAFHARAGWSAGLDGAGVASCGAVCFVDGVSWGIGERSAVGTSAYGFLFDDVAG